MTKYLIALTLICISFSSFSQIKRNRTKPSPDSTAVYDQTSGRKGDKKERIKELNLTNDQKVKFKELKTSHKQLKNAIQDDATLSAAQKQEKLKKLREDHVEKIKSILTADQFEKYKRSRKHKGA